MAVAWDMAHRLLLILIKGGAAEVVPMKARYRLTVAVRQKPKRSKKSAKAPSLAIIARRYMEVRRLREQLSEAESRTGAR